jgi:shikimate kinase
MNIILLGYRGSGKTTIARILADQLWKTFVDIDAEIIKRFEGRSIREIWDIFGEAMFRQVEVDVTREVCSKDEQVIALGGGTLMTPEAREAIVASDAVRIYLECKPEVLLGRIQGDQQTAATRPNLTGLGGGLDEIRAVLAERDPVYRAVADKVFDVNDVTIEGAVPHLIKRCL